MTIVRRLMMAGALALALADPAFAQGYLAPIGIQQHDNNGNPCASCVIVSFAAGTTTPLATFADAALATSNGTSVTLDSAGRKEIYLDSRLSYKLTLRTAGGADIWTRDSIVGQLSGVITAQAANTRGIQVTRPSADAGISIASSGGSGKTYGIVSNTTGALVIRDDADGTPNLTFSGNDIIATQTGIFSIAGGLLQQSGAAGDHVLTGSTNGPNRLGIRNASTGNAAVASLMLGNDAVVNTGAIFALGSGYATSGSYVADGVSVEATRAGGLSLNASASAGDVRIYSGGNTTPRVTVDDTGLTTVSQLTATIQNSGTSQPGFMAFNSATDTVASGATVDFDTEVYDTASNFASDVFTAPRAGIYEFCTGVTFSDNASSTFNIFFNHASASLFYPVYQALAVTSGAGSGCIHLSLASGATVSIMITTTDASANIEGVSGSIRQTWFSGRLVP